MNASQRLPAICAFFEAMSPADLARLDTLYGREAWFKDPFNEVTGLEAIYRVYAHMFHALEHPRFVITHRMAQGGECFLVWEFHFGSSGLRDKQNTIFGSTHLLLDNAGLIARHRDYWDSAEELYEKVPYLGGFMRWLKRRASSS